ncbi:TPA: Rha family transcriptional regulator [Streptococcus suis 2524]|uniref:Rha family transcriptional regulator n=1 Tax=Streptococcus suis TaxID=1307 RepID=UPI000462AD53|nr:Rha family transcriptional regulator [Streptococcus suis]HEM3217794.1 Rha family transcriptional regulator [Streptococcus suis 2524]HEM4181421.1 Rha family transcriptional regulator [Streptococcus suis]HEM4978671.1 Rha family transcriptional regulator [Streptococcus suis]
MRRNYSQHLNDFCTTYRLSGAQVARMVGMAEETIQAIRRGKRNPQQATKDKLNRFILNYKKENQPMTPITSQETQTDIVGIDSRTVAEWTGKQHSELMKDIRRYEDYLKQGKILWQETTYTASNGKENPCYMITKKGCEFIQHKMTGQKGAVFTAKYINYFWEQGEQLQEATQILLDLSDQPNQPAIELNSDMAYIKNRLAELQSMTTMADIKVGLAKTYRIAELMED